MEEKTEVTTSKKTAATSSVRPTKKQKELLNFIEE
jgi:hypothetical protein